MINLCKIALERDGCILCQMEKNLIDPKELLKESLFPIQISPDDIKKYSIDGKIIEGCLFAKSKDSYMRFVLDYSVKKKEEKEDEESDIDYVFRHISFRNERRKILLDNGNQYVIKTDEKSGAKYIFLKDSIIVVGWKEEKDFISPLIIGKFNDGEHYHYYGSLSPDGRKIAVRRAEALEDIPDSLLKHFNENSDFKIIGCEEDWNGKTLKLRTFGEDCFEDFLPFPPYEIICALKLLPPEEVAKAKEEELPPLLQSPLVLKTFLVPEQKIPVVEVSAGVLKTFSAHIQRNLYLPKIMTEDADFEYKTLYENSLGYAILTRPQFPLKEKKG